MKTKMLTVLLVLVLAAGISATESQKLGCLCSAGVSVPSGFLSQGYNNGVHATIGVVYDLSPVVSIVPKLEYHYLSFNIPPKSGWSGGGLTTPMFGVDLIVIPQIPTSSVDPMLVFGGGISYVTVADLIGSDGTSLGGGGEARAFLNIGGGLVFPSTTGPSIFISARYVYIPTSGQDLSFVPISVGLKFK